MPKEKPSSQKPLIQGQKVVIAEHIQQLTIYEGIKPVSAGDVLNACVSQVKSTIRDVGLKFNSDLYVHRKIETEINEFIESPLKDLSPKCYLIVAPAGSGKTNLVCNLARALVAQQPILLLLGGNINLDNNSGLLLGTLQSELKIANSEIAFRSAEDCLHALDRLGIELNCASVVILDAINEYKRPAEMRNAIEDLFRKIRGRRIKLVITCRDYYWGLFKGHFWKEATINKLPEVVDSKIESEKEDADFSRFAKSEYEEAINLYLEHYKISGKPVGKAAEQCRHPLLLRFFCAAYSGEEIGETEDIRLKELFDRYWDKKLESIAERMVKQGAERLLNGLEQEIGDYILNIARHMLHNNVRALPIEDLSKITGHTEPYDDPKSPYGRISDEYIILEEKERGKGRHKSFQVAFVYEEFMEYVMARSLIDDWDKADYDDAKILAEIEKHFKKYESFTQLFGVIVYLALMLKTDRDLALWSLLTNQGDHWQNAIFEAVRKLPEDQLDSGVFDALKEMLCSSEQAVQINVLDTLKEKRLGKTAPPDLVILVSEKVSHLHESIAGRAVLALGNMPLSLDTDGFNKALMHSVKTVRLNAVTALLSLKNTQAIDLLIAALKDTENEVRKSAAKALGEIGDQRAVEPLIALLMDSDGIVKEQAALALGEIGDQRAVEPLITALRIKDREFGLKQNAAQALGEIGDQRAVNPLIAALKVTNWHVRLRAAEALGEIGDQRAVEPIIAVIKESYGDSREWAAQTAEKLGEPALDPITVVSNDTHLKIRELAAEALGKIGDQGAVDQLIRILKDSHYGIRIEVAKALGKIGDQRAVEPLIDALQDTDLYVRKHAAEALGKIGDKRAVEPLIAALKDTNWEVQERAAEALGKIGDHKALGPLIAVLQPHYKVRMRAAEALGEIGSWRALEPLITDQNNIGLDIRVQESAVRALVNALNDTIFDVQKSAVEALEK